MGMAVFVGMTLRLDPLTAVRLPVPKEQILERAAQIASPWIQGREGQELRVQLLSDRAWLRYLQRQFGPLKAHQWIREGAPVFRWQVKWAPNRWPFRYAQEMPEEQTLEILRSTLIGEASMELDPRGNLLSFSRRPSRSDSARVILDSTAARELAVSFLRVATDLSDSELRNLRLRREERPGPPLFVFRLERPTMVPGVTATIAVVVGRDGIRSCRTEFNLPQAAPPGTSGGATQVFSLMGLVALLGLAIVYLVRRLRADQLDLGEGIPLAALAAVCIGANVFFHQTADAGLGYEAIGLVFIFAIIGVVTLALYALSMSLGHDVWPEKCRPLSALARGMVFSRATGEDILRGFLWGGIAAGSVRILDWLYLRFGHAGFLLDTRQTIFSSGSPMLLVLCAATSLALIRELAMRSFLVSYLRRFVSGTTPLVFLGFLAGLFDFAGLGLGEMEPGTVQLLRQGLLGGVMTASLIHGSFLVPIAASWFIAMLHKSLALLAAGMSASGVAGLLCLAAVTVVAAAGALWGSAPEDLRRLEPAYIARLAERERLQRELEIARNVQRSFLPSDLPRMPGLDIATRCVPATEVGGDYYDLFVLAPDRLGVVIGDVSGKGIGAAFYMTLTKGFLRACTQQSDSPKAVLDQVNQLFYENAERGRFISMIYGIFDLGDRRFSFARAGHNPILLRRGAGGTVESFAPGGMALGLAQSSLFSDVTDEQVVPFGSGDVFVLYTDGFTEAMTTEEVEYGEERLAQALRAMDPQWSAEQILEELFRSVRDFVGKGKQHDDMTLVVVKVL
jgi:hypothetical protein